MYFPNPIAPTPPLGDLSNRIATTAFVRGEMPFVNVADFGAGFGSSDDSSAINTAILASSGGIVYIPPVNYNIANPVKIGNGSSTAQSTQPGVLLLGGGVPNFVSFANRSAIGGPKFTWTGSSNNNMILILGPLQGWGIHNLFLYGNNTAALNGLTVLSGSLGDCRNLSIENCGGNALVSTTYPLGDYAGVENVDSFRNNYTNLFITYPGGGNGVVLTGESGGTSNTDYNTLVNVFSRLSSGAGGTGIYLGVTDSNNFYNVATTNLQFDYSIDSNFPNSNNFFGYEIFAFANNGSPGAGVRDNKFYGALEANAAPYPTQASTYAVDGPWLTYTPSPVSNTATFTVNNAHYKRVGKSVYFQIDLSITGGAPTNSIQFNTPTTQNTTGGCAGGEIATTFYMVVGYSISGTQMQLVNPSLANFTVGERVLASGVYESA